MVGSRRRCRRTRARPRRNRHTLPGWRLTAPTVDYISNVIAMDFRWNAWNEEHIGKHGVTLEEAEAVVRSAASPFPLRRSDDKWLAWGRTAPEHGRRLLQVVFVLDDDGSIFVIHARPLTPRERQRFHKGKRP